MPGVFGLTPEDLRLSREVTMMTPLEWAQLSFLKRSDFSSPDNLQLSIVKALDTFIGQLKVKPDILSDYRPWTASNPNSQHSRGLAIDVAFGALNPLDTLSAAEKSGLFDGIGIYRNEKGAISFHFDKRGSKARWGGVITHPVDPDTGKTSKQIDYVSLQAVIDLIKKKSAIRRVNGCTTRLFTVANSKETLTDEALLCHEVEIPPELRLQKKSWIAKAISLGQKAWPLLKMIIPKLWSLLTKSK
jgi:hypothetical protein